MSLVFGRLSASYLVVDAGHLPLNIGVSVPLYLSGGGLRLSTTAGSEDDIGIFERHGG